jgi:hypothetical protein
MNARILAASVVLLSACYDADDSAGGDDFVDPYMDEPLPPSCRETTSTGCGESSESGEVDACEASTQCPADQVCLGAFDGDRSPFICTASCVPTESESEWCTDDASCCDANAHCSPRGYCLAP